MENYVLMIVALIIAAILVKKFVGCVFRIIVLIVLIIVLACLAYTAKAQKFEKLETIKAKAAAAAQAAKEAAQAAAGVASDEAEGVAGKTADFAETQWDKAKEKAQAIKNVIKPKKVANPKYLVGACPEEDGKIVWKDTIEAPGYSAKAIYDSLIVRLDEYCHQEGRGDNSAIAVVNQEDHQIGARISDEIVFKNSALSKDVTDMNYTLIVDCKDGKAEATIKGISFTYQPGEKGGGNFTAEEMIADDVCLNKDKTYFRRGAGYEKFRTKSIDKRDSIFKYIKDSIYGKTTQEAQQ